jgi:hypothetical protein
MSNPPDPPEFSSASHAYEHAEHAGDRPPAHRLDVTDAPRWPAAPPGPRLGDPARPVQHVVTHRVDSPTRSAFKFGFGFAAGEWTFRVLILVVVWAIVAIGVGSLLMRVFPS